MVFDINDVQRQYYGPSAPEYSGGPHSITYTHIPTSIQVRDSFIGTANMYKRDRELLTKLRRMVEDEQS